MRWPGHGSGPSSATALVATVLQSLGRGGGGRNGLVVVESRLGAFYRRSEAVEEGRTR